MAYNVSLSETEAEISLETPFVVGLEAVEEEDDSDSDGGGSTPSLKKSCPSAATNGAYEIEFEYEDADGDIETLSEFVFFVSETHTDISSEMSGTSGTYAHTLSLDALPSGFVNTIVSYYVTDAAGNQSNTVSCTLAGE